MITHEEALARYGDVLCRFSDYYKYMFTFYGIAPDGALITLVLGGYADNIYDVSVSADHMLCLRTFDGLGASITRDGETLYSFFDM